MAMFRQGLLSLMWWIGLLPTLFFLVLVTTFILSAVAKHSTQSPAPAPPPSPADLTCDPSVLRNAITVWVLLVAKCLVGSAGGIFSIRILVDTYDGFEQRFFTKDEKAYNEAKAELDKAQTECSKAVQDEKNAQSGISGRMTVSTARQNAQRARTTLEQAKKKADRCKPQDGISRFPTFFRRAIRLWFHVAIVFSAAACYCGCKAFYLALQLELHCVTPWYEVLSFVIIGVMVAPPHVILFWVAATQD